MVGSAQTLEEAGIYELTDPVNRHQRHVLALAEDLGGRGVGGGRNG